MEKSLRLLGHQVSDLVSGFKGCVTVDPGIDKKTGKRGESAWFDTKRLRRLSRKPAIAQPDFVDPPGGQILPAPPQHPS